MKTNKSTLTTSNLTTEEFRNSIPTYIKRQQNYHIFSEKVLGERQAHKKWDSRTSFSPSNVGLYNLESQMLDPSPRVLKSREGIR